MAQKGELTRQRILDAAAELMQAQGFHATGLNQIIQESGAPKGSLYFHFPEGKEAIAVAAMEQSGRQLTTVLQQLLTLAPTMPEALDTLWRFFIMALEGSDYRKGCPIATLTLEAAAESAGIQVTGAAIYRQWQDLLRDKLVQGGMKQDKADVCAGALLALLEGALVLARAQRSTLPLTQSLLAAKALI